MTVQSDPSPKSGLDLPSNAGQVAEFRPRGVVVLGVYRSGTSLTSQVLHKLGVHFGPVASLRPPTPRNPGGYFERYDINAANLAFIRSCGVDHEPLPDDPEAALRRGDRSQLTALDLRWRDIAVPWGIKCPRHCITLLPWVWAGLIDPSNTIVIYVRRDRTRVARSLTGITPLNIDSAQEHTDWLIQWAEWTAQHVPMPVVHIEYEKLICEPRRTVEALAEAVGLTDPRPVERAMGVIGKKKSMWKFYVHRFTYDLPCRVIARLARPG